MNVSMDRDNSSSVRIDEVMNGNMCSSSSQYGYLTLKFLLSFFCGNKYKTAQLVHTLAMSKVVFAKKKLSCLLQGFGKTRILVRMLSTVSI